MVFSATTNKDGIIQTIEWWTRLPDGDITGTLLKQFTGRVNRAFDTIMPLLLSYSDHIRWDDTNHTDRPIGTVNIVSGQQDYTVTSDDNSLAILNLTQVRVLESASASDYVTLQRMTMDDPRVVDALSPNSSDTGVPTHYVEQGNSIFLYPKPNYAATNGIKLFFEREPAYFDSTDTTKTPGIPSPFHELLALYPALDWVSVNRPTDTNTINLIQSRISAKEQSLFDMISLRNPTKSRFSTSYEGGTGNFSGKLSYNRGDSSK